MIAFLKGTLAARTADAAVIEVGGIGFTVGMSGNSLQKLPMVGQQVQVHTYLQVREDALTLFGFVSLEEKALFEKLIGVSGVGPKVALAALTSFTPDALSRAIIAGDAASVSRIPGIGKKTAQRIILELQGALSKAPAPVEGQMPLGNGDAKKRASEDLLAMGFSPAEAEVALEGASEVADESALLQYALKRLGARS